MKENFIFIGDSLTFGYGVKKEKSWVSLYSNISELNVINKGINGNTSTDILFRFFEDVTSFNPKKVFIMCGTNDLLSNHSVISIIDNIELMIKDLKSHNTEVIIGIPPCIIKEDAYKLFMPSLTYDYCEKSLPILREKLLSLCKKYNCSIIDFYNTTLKNKDIFIDGIHFNESGHKLLFEKAKESL